MNLLNNSSAAKNVWSSAKVNSLGETSDVKFLSSLQSAFAFNLTDIDSLTKNTLMDTQLDKFDKFEASRMFLTKKYFLSSQLKNNVLVLDLQFSSPNAPTYLSESNKKSLLV